MVVASSVPGAAGGCGPCFFLSPSLLCPWPEQIPRERRTVDMPVTTSHRNWHEPPVTPDQAPPPSQASVSSLSATWFLGRGSRGRTQSIQADRPSCRPSPKQAPGQEEPGGAGKSGGCGPARRRRGRRRPQERPQMLPAFLEGSARPAPPDVPHKQLPLANKVSAWLQLAAHRRRLNAWHRAGEGACPGRGLGEGQAAHAQNPTPWPWPWLQRDHAPSPP